MESACVYILYDVNVDILMIKWKKSPSFIEFKEAHVAILQFVETSSSVTSFCTDLTYIGPLSREQEAWLMLEYYPNVYNCIKTDVNIAVVFSEEHFKAIVTNYQQPVNLLFQEFINFNYFTDFREATYWLEDIKRGQDKFSSMLS